MVKVLYVYYGTAGLAGAYIHGIAQSMREAANTRCHFAVNHYYRFAELESEVLRLFFPFTELTSENRFLRVPVLRYLRLPIRYVELVIAYVYLLFYVVLKHIDVVNLSLTDNRIITILFAIGVKMLGRKLFVTAHDSIPHGAGASVARRRYVYELTDKVIVHYDHVREHLVEYFGLCPSRISLHPYPWSDVTSIINEDKYAKYLQTAREMVRAFRRVFLFIGVLRPEKGLTDLISAWTRTGFEVDDGCLLLVAGRPVGAEDKVITTDSPTVRLIGRYLDSEEFWALLNVADVVVMPYAVRYYAHSSVALMSFLASTCIVASDIPLFERLIDDDNGYKFRASDVDDLACVLIQVAKEDAEDLRRKGEIGRQRTIAEWAGLPSALDKLYSSSGC